MLDLNKVAKAKGLDDKLNRSNVRTDNGSTEPSGSNSISLLQKHWSLPVSSSASNNQSFLLLAQDNSKRDSFRFSWLADSMSCLQNQERKDVPSSSIFYMDISRQKHSSTEELKKLLRKELIFIGHPVNELVKLFKSTFESSVIANSRNLEDASLSSIETEEIINQAILPIKMILKLLREFTFQVYKDVISIYEEDLRNEDQNPLTVIDQLICQLLFDDINNQIYQHVTKCLAFKCKEKVEYFQQIAEQFRDKCLHEFDSQFKDKYLLESPVPYKTVIKTVQKLKMLANPYMKKDYITMMEQEMICSIKSEMMKRGHHDDEVRLEIDDKFTIYTYCLVRSNYSNIIVDIALIEEFTIPDDADQAYARFKGCLNDYILSTDFPKIMKAEEDLWRKMLAKKAKRSCCANI